MRLSAADEMTIRWYALESESDMGLRSPMGSMLERARAGQLFETGNTTPEPDMSRAIAASQKATRIRNRLRSMGQPYGDLLLCAYCAGPPPGLLSLGRLGSVAPFTPAAVQAYGRKSRPRRSTLARQLGAMLSKSLVLRTKVLAECDEMLSEACRRWGKV